MGASSSSCADNNTFLRNIQLGNVPSKSSITYEGYINNYFFDTGITETKLVLEPSFNYAKLAKGSSNKTSASLIENENYFLTVGLNSVYDGNPPRSKTKFVFLLDISGSMQSPFYENDPSTEGATRESKLDVAKKALTTLATQHLLKKSNNADQAEDHLCILAFDDTVEEVLPMQANDEQIMTFDKIVSSLQPLQPRGGTDMMRGIKSSLETLLIAKNAEQDKTYNYRAIVLTDMNTNLGDTKPDSLRSVITSFAETHSIYTTYIGIGVDFNTNLAEDLAGIRGGNYKTVLSEAEFKKQMTENFSYMVSPVAFNVKVTLDNDIFTIDSVYGVPGKENMTPDMVLYSKNIFPTPKDESDNVKGGVILVKLKVKDASLLEQAKSSKSTVELKFHTSYTDFKGMQAEYSNSMNIDFDALSQQDEANDRSFYESNGIQKAVLLYELMQITKETIDIMHDTHDKKFIVSKEQKDKVRAFHDYYIQQIEQLNDQNLASELEPLVKFMSAAETATQEEEEVKPGNDA